MSGCSTLAIGCCVLWTGGGNRRGGVLAQRAVPQEPADQADSDQGDSRVEQLGRSPDLRAPARRTCRAGPGLGKPGQTTSAALLEASGQH